MTDTSIIDTQPSVEVSSPSTFQSQLSPSSLKDQLKTLSLEERYILLSSINNEERESIIKHQQQKIKDEEDKLAQCPVSKTVKSMSMEIQELKMELQKLKNKINENQNEKNLPINNMRCPYSIFRVNQDYLNRNSSSDYEYDLCNEIEETCSSTWSWWSIIMFVIFILLVITSKPPKNCEEFFTTRM
jgi:hypothetical protein